MTTHDVRPVTGSAVPGGRVTLLSDMSEADAGGGLTHDAASGAVHDDSAQPRLIDVGLIADYRARWQVMQGDFIDAPRCAVTDADAMVGEVLTHVGATFAQQRKALEQGWGDDEFDTKELRIALRRYRAFFDRLLTL